MNSSRVQFTMYSRGGFLWNRTSCQQRHITIHLYFFMAANVRGTEDVCLFHKQSKGLFTINTHSNLPESCEMDLCAASFLGVPPHPASRSSYTAEYNPSTEKSTESNRDRSGKENIFGATHVLQMKNMAVTWSKAFDNPWTTLLL